MTTSIVVVYVYPVADGDHDTYARRFASSYRRFMPTTAHQLVVVANGGEPTDTMRETFADIEVSWLVHDDSGWDIGAYRHAARTIPCDLMVFFGGSSQVRGARWLERIIESFEAHGEAIYGAMGSLGHNIHIRTTAFWLPPALLNQYPYATTSDRESRYDFEHGKHGLTMWVLSRGLKAWMVTWGGTYEHWQWDGVPNGFHRGDQSALIAWDRLADPPYHVPRVADREMGHIGSTPVQPSHAVTWPSRLTLVYVVRASSNTEPIYRFFTEYRKFSAGIAKNFVIAAVAFANEAATLIMKQIWSEITPQPTVVLIPDPGFRLGVFREACLRLTTKYVCLLDTSSRPLAAGWLKRLYSVASRPGVGIAGATGAHQIDPHVRDNGFCINRNLYLEVTHGATAKDARMLEAGPRSITRRVRERMLAARVVGRSHDRDIIEAREGRTFWWDNQDELLIADDQTDDYANGSEERRAFLRSAGWPGRGPDP